MWHKISVGLVLLSLAWSSSLAAATRTVTDLGDSGQPGQLRTLMNAAASGDTILIPAGTITLTGAAGDDLNVSGDLDVLKNLTIQGAGAGLTIIDGGLVDGVFDILAPNTVTISGVTIRNGLSVQAVQAGGGGIRNFGTLNLANAIVSGNESARGSGGIRNNGGGIRNLGSMTLTNVIVTGNIARGRGAGIYNELGGVLTLTDVTVSANRAEIDGAGIYSLGAATLTNVTVSGNNADANAGGIFTGGSGATATLVNVTVSGNTAAASGGGIFNSATMALTNVTVTANTANSSGGGILSFSSGLPATVKNVIASGNGDALVPGTGNCSGIITSLGHNLDNGNTCAFTQPGDLSITNPLLGPLQNNGGLTFTHALLAGSPAIDAGTNTGCPATDQRGVARGAICDIGAYESPNGIPRPVLAILPASLAGGTVGTAYSQTLTLSVTNGVSYTPPSPAFSVTAGTLPTGLGLGSATGVISGTPTAAGPFNFTIGATDTNGFSASRVYAVTIQPSGKTPSTTTFTTTAPASLAFGQTYTPAATSTGDGTLTIGASGACSIAGGVVTITAGSGVCTVTATESEGNNRLGSSATPQSITATSANATVTVNSSSVVYDGQPHSATASTNPPGLSVSFTYNGSATAPTAAGAYAVVATINDPNHQGSGNGTLTITKAPSTTTFTSTAPASLAFGQTYTPAATSTGDGALTIGASGSCSMAGGVVTITSGSGVCTITATESEGANRLGSAATPQSITAAKANATVTVNNVSVVFDGQPHSATASTNPSGLPVSFTYNGSATPPAQPGVYAVVGTINHPNYQGSGNGTLTIATTNIGTLQAQVGSLNLNDGNKNSLMKKLEGAQEALDRGNKGEAANKLGAFINEVQAIERSGRLDAATAGSLIAQATLIVTGM